VNTIPSVALRLVSFHGYWAESVQFQSW